MLSDVEVVSLNPGRPDLWLGGLYPNDHKLQIRDIKGLEPVKADVTSAANVTSRGKFLLGTNVGERNIVFMIGLNPNWAEQTMAALRQELYGYFMPQLYTKLRFFSEGVPPEVHIEGIVETCEPNIFSEDPEMQVSILCHKPDFVDPVIQMVYGVVDDGTVEATINYIGTQPTGVELRINPAVDNPEYSGPLDITLNTPLIAQQFGLSLVEIDANRYFRLSTVPGQKRVEYVDAVTQARTNLLGRMSDTSRWLQLDPGVNHLKIAAGEPGQSWSLGYFNRFGGL